MKQRRFLTLLSTVLLPLLLSAQRGTITGRVTDAETGDGLAGANVLVEGTTLGAAADVIGEFIIGNVSDGTYTITGMVIGYDDASESVSVPSGGSVNIDFSLIRAPIELSGLKVVASRARHRETPVAFTNIEKADMQMRLGSRDVPMILNTTPGVYATEQGGGAGDARINIRGFDQRNVAVMINGVPVNDMENSWVYWSNWDGLGDATSSIQVQRGLGASNLAVASVGGTMNVITDIAALRQGGSFKQELGNDNFLKSTITLSTGRMADRFRASFVGGRKTGKGYADQTWTDAWSYFAAFNYTMSATHAFDLFVVGAPQRHGQRRNSQSIDYWDAEYAAREFDIDTTGAKNYGLDFNPHWGPIDAPSEAIKEYFDDKERDARDTKVIMERENYFHKPQINFNWYWKMADNLHLTSVFYYSRGKGGGTGRYGLRTSSISSGENKGQINYQKVYEKNSDNVDTDYHSSDNRATSIIRNSVNRHYWYGYLGTAKYQLSEKLRLTGGLDYRYYIGQHWREVRNLLGGDYYIDTRSGSPRNENETEIIPKRLGDKVNYWNDGITTWIGGFGQLEGTTGPLTAFGSFSYSVTGYKRIDYFNVPDAGPTSNGEWETDFENFPGYTFKAGANYNVSEQLNVYANFGNLSIAPKFDAVYNFDNTVYQNYINETVTAFEVGAGFRTSMVFANANYYYTLWEDRDWPGFSRVAGENFFYLLEGIDALHTGIELDAKIRPMAMLELYGMVSLGNWEWLNDVESRFTPDTFDTIFVANVYTKGLKVANAAQTTYSVGATVRPIRGLWANVTMKFFADIYANFGPANRNDPEDNEQPWKMPDYSLVDLHAGYTLPVKFVRAELGLHVFNLLDTQHITDAGDRGGHMAEDARVFFGPGLRWNLALNITF